MRYALLMYGIESRLTDAERRACMVESLAVCDELAARRRLIAVSPLRPLVTAGPFAETVEQLGGYFVLDLPDLDEAIETACRLPPTRLGTAEIRPIATTEPFRPGGTHLLLFRGDPVTVAGHHGAAVFHPADTATSVRLSAGKVVLTDGPATAVALSGFAVVRDPVPAALPDSVDVRPLFDLTLLRPDWSL